MKKILATLAALVAATLSANAEDHNLASNVPYAIAPQYPVQSESFDYEVGASYTYWVPYQNGMILGYYNGDADTRGNYIQPYTQGQSGFKLRIGIVTPHDGWSAFINYTWFNNDNKFKTATIDLPDTYTSLYLAEDGGTYPTIQTKFRNQFNRIDGFLDRSFYIGKYSIFRPWVGILGAFEKQYLDVLGQNDDDDSSAAFYAKHHWWGVGPYAGLESTYFFTKMFGLFVSGGGSLLVANHYVPETLTVQPSVGDAIAAQNINPTYNDLEPMAEIGLGLALNAYWKQCALLLRLKWENQTYFSHNAITPIDPLTGNRGTYSMQGLTFDISMQF